MEHQKEVRRVKKRIENNGILIISTVILLQYGLAFVVLNHCHTKQYCFFAFIMNFLSWCLDSFIMHIVRIEGDKRLGRATRYVGGAVLSILIFVPVVVLLYKAENVIIGMVCVGILTICVSCIAMGKIFVMCKGQLNKVRVVITLMNGTAFLACYEISQFHALYVGWYDYMKFVTMTFIMIVETLVLSILSGLRENMMGGRNK